MENKETGFAVGVNLQKQISNTKAQKSYASAVSPQKALTPTEVELNGTSHLNEQANSTYSNSADCTVMHLPINAKNKPSPSETIRPNSQYSSNRSDKNDSVVNKGKNATNQHTLGQENNGRPLWST